MSIIICQYLDIIFLLFTQHLMAFQFNFQSILWRDFTIKLQTAIHVTRALVLYIFYIKLFDCCVFFYCFLFYFWGQHWFLCYFRIYFKFNIKHKQWFHFQNENDIKRSLNLYSIQITMIIIVWMLFISS